MRRGFTVGQGRSCLRSNDVLWSWVPAFAGTTDEDSFSNSNMQSFAISQQVFLREFCSLVPLSPKRGRRECRALNAPAASHAK
jgi:hypothetical protein